MHSLALMQLLGFACVSFMSSEFLNHDITNTGRRKGQIHAEPNTVSDSHRNTHTYVAKEAITVPPCSNEANRYQHEEIIPAM